MPAVNNLVNLINPITTDFQGSMQSPSKRKFNLIAYL